MIYKILMVLLVISILLAAYTISNGMNWLSGILGFVAGFCAVWIGDRLDDLT